ncbi:MAG TPA: phenylalanine--tRNA ligase subunit beta [Chitinophagaceae bacterium]
MTISHNWLSEYLPVKIEPEKLSRILTSIGLEVESLDKYEEVKGGLKGLILAEVLESIQHPKADKLRLTKVDTGNGEPLQIVCGAPNVAVGQKVVVAPVGATIFPSSGDPLTMKVAKIRGIESYGMICAEDEIGMGSSHEGIMVLPDNVKAGTEAADYFQPYEDWIYEIGLTPNRMDAMSHLGVARDVCAYLSFHEKKEHRVKWPYKNNFKPDNNSLPITVSIENSTACERYSGVSISNVVVKDSPKWLQQRLKAIGLRPINNIVDITNYILHETGQPLHAFDADKISGNKIIVKNLPQDSLFITLDEKERKLHADDLMICNDQEGMCIAGVFGGISSGVDFQTKNVFLESAFFNPVMIRKTSFRHGLRTDAATRFEKGIDISNTVNVLKRAALLIKETAGGEISSDIVDVYPQIKDKTTVGIKYHYLKKLSGKNYHPDAVKNILQSLGFEVLKEGIDELWVAAPYHKPDIQLAADIVEEVIRIDGLDNIDISGSITISPSVEENYEKETFREKISNQLVGAGFHQIMTNSITRSDYYSEEELKEGVKMINNLSEELNIMRLSLLETGLESIAYNLNHKNNNLRFFEFGKTYKNKGIGRYQEQEHLCLYVTGNITESGWRTQQGNADFYFLKGITDKILKIAGVQIENDENFSNEKVSEGLKSFINGEMVLETAIVSQKILREFNVKQPVYCADFNWDVLSKYMVENKIWYKEIPKYPAMQRDLAVIVPADLQYVELQKAIQKLRLPKLKNFKLFDVFENEKLGAAKKSMAVNFTFLDEEKTLTDKEIDGWMNKIISSLEKELAAEIRK